MRAGPRDAFPKKFAGCFLVAGIVIASVSVGQLAAKGVSSNLFVTAASSSAIYHDGWIDFNKNGAKDPYEDPALSPETRIEDLLRRMSPDEKTAQMVTLYGYPRVVKDELPTTGWKNAFWKDGIGNIDEHGNGHSGWIERYKKLPLARYAFPWSRHVQARNEVQRWFVEQTRLGIPVDFTNEGIRGLAHSQATSFPAQLGVASAFDRDLVNGIGRVTGSEARALGYTNVYSPILDLARDPRWGRTTETYGEAPFLAGELGMAQVRGLQDERVVSTLKHFAVYSVMKGSRDGDARADPQVSWREVQTTLLYPFRKAVRDAGALGVMASYNDYDGIPVQASRQFLTDILRDEYGFKGYVVSDSGSVERVHYHHRVAPTALEAVRQSVEAGLNVRTNFTAPEDYGRLLRQLVADGRLSMDVIDSRVRDILRVKFWLGLFDQPYVADPAAAENVVRSPEHLALAARAARESIVLLKNEGRLLPLRGDLKKILVVGPMADDAVGWWSRYGPPWIDFVTPLAGLRQKLGPQVEVKYAKGCDVVDARFPESDVFKLPPSEKVKAGIAEAVAAARDVDVVIAVLGEDELISREDASRISLDLPGFQEDLLRALHETGKPIVLVLTNGRPLSINWAQRFVPAIVEMWFPGDLGGAALADVLVGDHNPSGKLPITFPKSVGQIPFNFPAKPGSQGRDGGQVQGALFPFGHGLSYTTFHYANLQVGPETIGAEGRVEVSCEVSNRGDRAGVEIVQLYLRDDYSSVTTYDKMLRGFARLSLKPGETATARFTITPEHLELYDRAGHWTAEPGRFTVMIGASSEDIRLQGNFTVAADDGSIPEEEPVREPQPLTM